jgi:hypothetical protein
MLALLCFGRRIGLGAIRRDRLFRDSAAAVANLVLAVLGTSRSHFEVALRDFNRACELAPDEPIGLSLSNPADIAAAKALAPI